MCSCDGGKVVAVERACVAVAVERACVAAV